MSQRTIDRVNDNYQRARMDYVNAVADLASRPQNIPFLYKARVLEQLRSLLSDVVPSIQSTAATALGRIANQDEKMAEEIIRNKSLVYLLSEFNMKNKVYKCAALFLIRSISRHSSDLAQAIVDSGCIEAILLCLEDFDPKVREESCWAVEYISRHSPILAETVVDAGILVMLVVCLQEVEVGLKRAASTALGAIARHSLELAQAVTDAKAIPYLARCIQNPDIKLKRQVFLALSNIAMHNLELAEFVVEAEVFPEVLIQIAHTDDLVKKNAASLVREVAKHSVEMAEFVVNSGGIGALISMLENTKGSVRLPAIMAIGYISAQLDQLASAVINAKGVTQLSMMLCEDEEDHIIAATVWTLGQIGKHSSEHAKSLALANVFPKLMKLYCCQRSSEDLRQKAKQSLKQTLQKCTHLQALESLLHEAPLSIMKYILGQFSKVLPHDSRARRLFVTTGGLRKVQQLVAKEGTPLHNYISIINLCFPEEIVRYYSPAYPASLLERLEYFEPRIPPEVLLADRRLSEEYVPEEEIPCRFYEEPSKDDLVETAPPALNYDLVNLELDIPKDDNEGREDNGTKGENLDSEEGYSEKGGLEPSGENFLRGSKVSKLGDDLISNDEPRKSNALRKVESDLPLVEIGKRSLASDVVTATDSDAQK